MSGSSESSCARSSAKAPELEGIVAPGTRDSGEEEMWARSPRWVVAGEERRDWKAVTRVGEAVGVLDGGSWGWKVVDEGRGRGEICL